MGRKSRNVIGAYKARALIKCTGPEQVKDQWDNVVVEITLRFYKGSLSIVYGQKNFKYSRRCRNENAMPLL